MVLQSTDVGWLSRGPRCDFARRSVISRHLFQTNPKDSVCVVSEEFFHNEAIHLTDLPIILEDHQVRDLGTSDVHCVLPVGGDAPARKIAIS